LSAADAAVDPTITTAIAAANARRRPKLKIFADIVSLLLIEFGSLSASRVPDRGAGLLGAAIGRRAEPRCKGLSALSKFHRPAGFESEKPKQRRRRSPCRGFRG
jgi:hypothetical protein